MTSINVVMPLFCASQDFAQGFGQSGLGLHHDTLPAAAFGNLCVAQIHVEFRADEVVVVPGDRIALFRSPLIVAENDHRNSRPFLTADRTHLVHRNAECTIAGKTDAGRVRIADLRANDGWKAVTARAKQSRRQVLSSFLDSWIRISYRAIITDVA